MPGKPCVFVTDDPDRFNRSDCREKILFSGSQLIKTTLLDEQETIDLNFRLSGAETSAGDQFVAALGEIVTSFDYSGWKNSAAAENTDSAQLYNFLFYPLIRYGMARFQLELLLKEINALVAEKDLLFDLGPEFAWFKHAYPEKTCLIRKQQPTNFRLRNLLALADKKIPDKSSGTKRRLMILSYDIGHHLELFRPFIQYTLQHSADIHFDIVILNFFGTKTFVPEHHVGKPDPRIRFHKFRDFKAFAGKSGRKLPDGLLSQFPVLNFLRDDPSIHARNMQYAWMEKCFETLKPSAAFICNIHEIGRVMSETGKKTGVPSVQVDYGLFSDHHMMSSSMNFSLRTCIGESTKEVWQRRNDRSDRIVPIGFLKLDEIDKQRSAANKDELWNQLGLDPARPTVFFASTWAVTGEIYDLEKKHLCAYLSEFCKKNGFNFLVKLHPLESPEDLSPLIVPSAGQKICTHSELDLNDALCFSDVVITQGSSIVLESLFWGKWPVFMGISDSKRLILAGMTNNDDITYFTPGTAFEQYVHQSLESETFKESLVDRVEKFQRHILYSTDQQAAARLFDETLKLINHVPSR